MLLPFRPRLRLGLHSSSTADFLRKAYPLPNPYSHNRWTRNWGQINFIQTLPPGRYAFWKNMAQVTFVQEDLRESMFDVAGQDIMTADKVTLRMNAVVTYRIVDARLAVSTVDDVRQALYREAAVGTACRGRCPRTRHVPDGQGRCGERTGRHGACACQALGVELIAMGIRDIILPGEMKDLMNKVTEAKKAAEANLIVRREETAAMRSQANTAKLLADNPTLMRLRELEVLEKVAANSKLKICWARRA